MKNQRTLKNDIRTGLALVGVFCLVGCTSPTFHSQKVETNKYPAKSAVGMAYFLPTGYIHFVAELQSGNGSSAKLAAAVVSNGTPASVNITVNQSNYAATPPATPPKADPAPTTPPATPAKSGYTFKVDAMLSPDPNSMFLLCPKLSDWAHDNFSIGVSNGFLTSINSSNSDQSGQVLVKLAQLAGDITYLVGKGIVTQSVPGEPPSLPQKIDIIIDPTDLKNAEPILNPAKLSIAAEPFGWTTNDNPQKCENKAEKKENRIFYRPLLPWKFTVVDRNNNSVMSTVLMLPNKAPVLALKPTRTSCVTTKTSITFSQGSPTSFSYDRESPYLAIASLPVDMIKAFLSAPAEMIQLKLNYVNTNAQLVGAQTTDLQNQLKLLQQQVALEEYMRTNSAR